MDAAGVGVPVTGELPPFPLGHGPWLLEPTVKSMEAHWQAKHATGLEVPA